MSKIFLEIWRFTNVGKINRANPKRLTVDIWKKRRKRILKAMQEEETSGTMEKDGGFLQQSQGTVNVGW